MWTHRCPYNSDACMHLELDDNCELCEYYGR